MKTETILKAIDLLKEKEGLGKALELLQNCNEVEIGREIRSSGVVIQTDCPNNSYFKNTAVSMEVMANLVEETHKYLQRIKAHLEYAIKQTKYKIEDLKDE